MYAIRSYYGQFVAVAVTGAITYFYVRTELEGLFDDRLRQLAYSVPTQGMLTLEPPPLTHLQDNDDDFVIQVWGKDGALRMHLNRKVGSPEQAAEGFSTHLSVITSYSIHYTKLYDSEALTHPTTSPSRSMRWVTS